MKIRNVCGVLAIAMMAGVGCGGGGPGGDEPNTPRSAPPAEIEGKWFTGTLSSIQYYDQYTGEFQNPSGEGFYFIFNHDGSYETGAVIDSTVGNCNMRLLGTEVGTTTSSGTELSVYRHWVKTKVTNSCGHDGERTQGEEMRSLTWAIEVDEDGLEWLSLTHDDGSVEWYRRWEQ